MRAQLIGALTLILALQLSPQLRAEPQIQTMAPDGTCVDQNREETDRHIAAIQSLLQPRRTGLITRLQSIFHSRRPERKVTTEQKTRDWAALCHYQAQDAAMAEKVRPHAIFIGDSITEFWAYDGSAIFSDLVLDRGIGGQTSRQLVERFNQDVLALHPDIVQIMIGTNDIAENDGPFDIEEYRANMEKMVDAALAANIQVAIASIPPANIFPWHRALHPIARIVEVNDWLKNYAAEKHLRYIDYFAALTDGQGGLRPELTNDGVHPNSAGYAAMAPLAHTL